MSSHLDLTQFVHQLKLEGRTRHNFWTTLTHLKTQWKNIWSKHAAWLPFWSLNVIQILNVQNHLLGLSFGSLCLVFCQLQVGSDNILQWLDVDLKPQTSKFWILASLLLATTGSVSPPLHIPAGRCSCTGRDLPWPNGSCGDPHRAPDTWAW